MEKEKSISELLLDDIRKSEKLIELEIAVTNYKLYWEGRVAEKTFWNI